MPELYDRDGSKIPWDDAQKKWADKNYRQVARAEMGGVTVSTIWMPLSHTGDEDPPLIFETMILGGDHDGEMWRDPTELDALGSHFHALGVAFNLRVRVA